MRFGIFALAIALVATVATASAQSIGGKYRVAGTNLNGSRYSGTAEIVSTGGATCRIAWTTGGTTAKGICMRHGDTLAAAYVMSGAIGLIVYQIKPDGVLDGVWTIADQAGSGTDVLTPMP
jgi:hypothetical protein